MLVISCMNNVTFDIIGSNNDWDEIVDCFQMENISIIHACFYKIVTKAKKPFLLFFLCENKTEICFFKKRYNKYEDVHILQSRISSVLNESLTIDEVKLVDDVLFVSISNNEDIDTKVNGNFVVATSFELINAKSVNFKKISSKLAEFIAKCPESITLLNSNQEPYEMPFVGYKNSNNKNDINYTLTFGCTKSPNAMYGPFYYFDLLPHNNAVKFALFTDFTYHVTNKTTSNLNYNDIMQNYDCIFVGQHESMHIKNFVVLKEYNQQCTISYKI